MVTRTSSLGGMSDQDNSVVILGIPDELGELHPSRGRGS
ncbi:hypothetical protein COO91_04709 [Nostoc flagelliforme CCNUN1]|uniref:Uncharacterized protein n=1 Tax=Nostoc flagelliforme CCNUN1 TaxID=2038116 RepID=A0A2K8STE4_9NOSO|nr:hypothetical protein COO91_04709 [Nostoc flagelliforme CCNUN1]